MAAGSSCATTALGGENGAKTLTMTPHRLLPPLLLTLLLAARPGGALARCPGCGQGAQAGCPGGCAAEEGAGHPAEGCAEAGGCLRREGQQCGVYTPNCAPGLQCQPPEEDQAPLRALLLGRGRCRPARAPTGESAPAPPIDTRFSAARILGRWAPAALPASGSCPWRFSPDPNPGGHVRGGRGKCGRQLEAGGQLGPGRCRTLLSLYLEGKETERWRGL